MKKVVDKIRKAWYYIKVAAEQDNNTAPWKPNIKQYAKPWRFREKNRLGRALDLRKIQNVDQVKKVKESQAQFETKDQKKRPCF